MTSFLHDIYENETDKTGSACARHQPGKRQFDCALALLVILLLSPLMLIVCLLIKASDGGPIIFKQKKIGMGGRKFDFLKFRSMIDNADQALLEHLARSTDARKEWENNQKLLNYPRVMQVGQFLRRTSLDELPQLFNVLLGDMSLVGPRPITPAEIAHYRDSIQLYLSVRPGLTGLWQVSGRSSCTYDERVTLDLQYIGEWSFGSDVLILAKTIPAVLKRTGSC